MDRPDPYEELRQLRDRLAELEAAAEPAEPGRGARQSADEQPVTRRPAPTFLRSDLADSKFFAENRPAIMEAIRSGRIIDDKPAWRIGGGPEHDAARQAARTRIKSEKETK